MPVEIRQLLIQTSVESPPQPNTEREQEHEEDDCQTGQADREEIVSHLMDNIKRQKER